MRAVLKGYQCINYNKSLMFATTRHPNACHNATSTNYFYCCNVVQRISCFVISFSLFGFFNYSPINSILSILSNLICSKC